MHFVEHNEAEQASEQLVSTLRNMSTTIRENFRSIDDATAPGRVLAREHRAEMVLKDTIAVNLSLVLLLYSLSAMHHQPFVLFS